MNPFLCEEYGPGVEELGAEARIRRVRDFSIGQCQEARKLPDLQRSVRVAIERRLRALAKAGIV